MRWIAVFLLAMTCSAACSEDSDGGGGSSGSGGAGGTDAAADVGGAGAGGADAAADTADAALQGTTGIACEAETCTTGSEVCCRKSTSQAWCAARTDAADQCAAPDGGVAAAQYCDDSFDCASGELCCDGLSSWGLTCVPVGACKGREKCTVESDCVSTGTVCIGDPNSSQSLFCGGASASVACGESSCKLPLGCCHQNGTESCEDFGCSFDRFFCKRAADCGASLRCCATGESSAPVTASCWFECGEQLSDILCEDAKDCPPSLPTCADAPGYFAGAKHCTP